MRAGQYQRQQIKMAMRQELTQSIAILQYSTQELSAYLEEKMIENPLLSMDELQPVVSSLGADYRSRSRIKLESQRTDWIEQVSADQVSLEDYLLSQVNLQHLSIKEISTLKELIRNLDDHGYLRISLEELVVPHITLLELQNALEVIQGLEPYGVGARTLQECLWIQAHVYSENLLAENILLSYFKEFTDRNWKGLCKKLGVSLKDIQRSSDYIRTLNPRPARDFQKELISYIVPDVMVTVCDGQIVIGDMEGNSSKLSVDKQYFNQMSHNPNQQIQRYFREKWQEYQWISRAIEQRRETILKVMHCIILKQPACFYHGIEWIKPMTMKEVADELDIHESTVSRAVNGKYVQTPFGTFEIRIFFSVSLASVESEEEFSGLKAKQWLADVIANESKSKPLSDQDLAQILKQDHGLMLARRTVAKYREQLGILSSSKRKRYD